MERDWRLGTALLFVVAVAFIALAIAHLRLANRHDLPALLGDRSEAIFDLWSLQHLCAGVLIGSLLVRSRLPGLAAWQDFALSTMLVAIGWETVELAMEAGLLGQAIATWKGSFEHWGNRLVGDPLMVACGGLIARRFSFAWKIALLPALVWLIINVLSPNSMSIQHLLFG